MLWAETLFLFWYLLEKVKMRILGVAVINTPCLSFTLLTMTLKIKLTIAF